MKPRAPEGEDYLICMARAPERGRVLGDLAYQAGEEQALVIYEKVLRAVADLYSHLPKTVTPAICLDQPDLRGKIETIFGGRTEVSICSAKSTGERIQAAISGGFARGAKRVTVISDECPWISKLHITQTFLALRTSKIVVGPASHGGFYLLGVSEAVPGVLAELEWDSNFLMDDMREFFRKHALAWTEIAPLSTIKSLNDWDEFERSRRA